MTLREQTLIIDLLRQREEAFLRICDCERQVQVILGQPYPFPPPPPLPSCRRRLPGKAGVPVGGTGLAASGPVRARLRRLQKGRENAYRVRYYGDGRAVESYQNDPDFLLRLLEIREPEFRVLRIEAGVLLAPDRFEVVEKLWEEPGAASGRGP